MKPLDWTYELHVFGTRPKALPLEDFGELVKRFADLLGSRQYVRFGALRPGSARILAKVLQPAVQDVCVQLLRTKNEGASAKQVTRIDEYLSARGWHGEVRNREGAVILHFPGVLNAKEPEEERTVHQIDTLVGQVIRIGGRDETVPMTLEISDGSYVDVTLRGKELAKKLALYLFGKDVKLSGLATWKRDTKGRWSCTGMLVDNFTEPDETPLTTLFSSLRNLPDNGWNSIQDPIAEWQKLRGDE